MDKKIESALKKSAKIAGVTCLALGGAALIASGAALKALTEGAKYVALSVKKIVDEKPAEETAEVVDAEPVPAEEPVDEAEAAPVEEVAAQPEEVETVVVEAE